ncbi:protein affecting phage T7 exclusion by the F plasmid [Thioflavicoccus mobilis 8321]|uniref:Protein affecting phage T7 exclusion by the F plasmid n=1 Tax=Thioflavicoccus mobilis 8321 TaxID=765912 RepID=L0GUL5_9GAMM|nr:FxsA family protein [Thioflavicoccus mobilis]AGA89050.1 protein affecting phage T7 exclusion by the F plasmid [Thioflavicoccus mobilis 8321]
MLQLLILFIVAPLAELYVLIQVGDQIGALPTILLSILTAIIGTFLVRQQGFAVLSRIQEQMRREEIPALEMLDGALLLVAGLLLLVPGFLTDAIGFALLVPALRHLLIGRYVQVFPAHRAGPGGTSNEDDAGPRIIDADYRREKD